MEIYYNGPSKQLNRVQYIGGGISPQKASHLLGNSGFRIRTRIQYLSIWTIVSPRPSTHEFWTFAPTIAPQNFGFSPSSKEKKQDFDFHDIRPHDSSIHTGGVDNSRASDLLLMLQGSQGAIKCSRWRTI